VPGVPVASSSMAASSGVASSSSPTLACTWKEGSYGACWIRAAGALDFTTSRQLRSTLAEANLRASLLLLDLRGLTFIDRAGLQVILDAVGRARRRGGQLVLVRGSGEVDDVFKATGAYAKVTTIDLDPTEPDPELFDLKQRRASA
jgi:anti-anti-sigma factor